MTAATDSEVWPILGRTRVGVVYTRCGQGQVWVLGSQREEGVKEPLKVGELRAGSTWTTA